MKLIALLLLFSALAAAACTSGGIREVTLTPSELGTLKLAELTETELAAFGIEENPGYLQPGKVSPLFPLAESGYLAVYKSGKGETIAVTTVVFNSDDVEANLETLASKGTLEGDSVLYKGNVLVLVAGGENDSELVSGIADKLSGRLGMDVIDKDQLVNSAQNPG